MSGLLPYLAAREYSSLLRALSAAALTAVLSSVHLVTSLRMREESAGLAAEAILPLISSTLNFLFSRLRPLSLFSMV
jgi:hypothetical protein